MRFSRLFKVKVHEEYGTLGLVLAHMPQFDPFPGMGVAHDIFEHFPNDTGTAVEEYMALGASLFVRDMGRYFEHTKDPVHHLEGEIDMILGYLANGGGVVGTIGKTMPIDEEDVEAAIQGTLTGSRRHMLNGRPPEDGEWNKDLHSQAEAIYPIIVPAMRTGFRKARRRYADVWRYDLCDLFQRTEKAVDRWLQNDGYGSQGCKVRITVDTKQLTVDLSEPQE